MNGTPDLATERLNIRRFKKYDAGQLVKWSCDEQTRRFFQASEVPTVAEAEDVITAWRGQYSQDSFLRWCIAEADGNRAVGEIYASVNPKLSSAELEYIMSPDARGKGYATEAVREVVRFLHEAGVHRVVAEVHIDNAASARVLEKAGMNLDGILPDALVDAKGEFYDVALFSHVDGRGNG